MSILFASSEIFPYAKSGGLADVSQALPEALRNSERVYTIMPLYDLIDREKYNLVYSGLTFDYWLAGIQHQFDIFHREDMPDDLFVYNPILCNRQGLYNDQHGDFGDNGLRFGLFSYAVLEVMIRMELDIQTIHVNDWQSALVPLLAKTRYHLPQKIVLTIHNLAYQGIFAKSVMNELEIDWEKCFKFEGLEYYDKVNYLKAGIFFADQITTVSHSYANEIQTPIFGYGLNKTLQINSHKLTGILNGISYEVFDPKSDQDLYKNFTARTFKNGKLSNKSSLLDEVGLSDEGKPLFVFIGRFTKQKGLDLILESLSLFKDFEANVVILGSGEDYYTHRFAALANRYDNIRIIIGYDEALSRKLYAGADFLLMPSIFEPCGLNQMIAMRYGTLPIVAKTGGLRDTVTDFTDIGELENHGGVGITFEEHNMFWFMHAIGKALSLYGNREKFNEIVKHDMQVDNSWKHSAALYRELYQQH